MSHLIVASPDLDKMDRLVQGVINTHHATIKSFKVTWIRNFDDDGDFLGWTPTADIVFKGVGDYEADIAKNISRTNTRH